MLTGAFVGRGGRLRGDASLTMGWALGTLRVPTASLEVLASLEGVPVTLGMRPFNVKEGVGRGLTHQGLVLAVLMSTFLSLPLWHCVHIGPSNIEHQSWCGQRR